MAGMKAPAASEARDRVLTDEEDQGLLGSRQRESWPFSERVQAAAS